MMEIGIVSDEISLDFQKAVKYGTSWGITKYEVRTLKTGRVPEVNSNEIRDVLTCLKENGIIITALSPGLFKFPISNKEGIERHLNILLPKTLELAAKLGVDKIIIFGFQHEKGEPDSNLAKVTDYLNMALDIGENSGVTFLVENEPGFWCDTGTNTAQILNQVKSPYLMANWDPCNAFGLGESPYPTGYESLKQFVANVHVKDTLKGGLIECVPIGEGLVDWDGQLRALVNEQKVQHITIETHCLPLIEKSKQNAETLMVMLEKLKGNQSQ
ncbi:MAG: sugar phosphate isomerase/epimerase family protein [Ignavibacteriaceae bacterium]